MKLVAISSDGLSKLLCPSGSKTIMIVAGSKLSDPWAITIFSEPIADLALRLSKDHKINKVVEGYNGDQLRYLSEASNSLVSALGGGNNVRNESKNAPFGISIDRM